MRWIRECFFIPFNDDEDGESVNLNKEEEKQREWMCWYKINWCYWWHKLTFQFVFLDFIKLLCSKQIGKMLNSIQICCHYIQIFRRKKRSTTQCKWNVWKNKIWGCQICITHIIHSKVSKKLHKVGKQPLHCTGRRRI